MNRIIVFILLLITSHRICLQAQTFTDVTIKTGVPNTVYSFEDIFNTGFQDIVSVEGNLFQGVGYTFQIFKNNNFYFTDISNKTGLALSDTGICYSLSNSRPIFLDFDNDGYKDCVLGALKESGAYIIVWGHRWDSTSTPFSMTDTSHIGFGLRDIANQAHIAQFFDVNNDGFLDLFFNRCSDEDNVGQQFAFYLNNGDRTFTQATLTTYGLPSTRNIVSVGDRNSDGKPDFRDYTFNDEKYFLSRPIPTYQFRSFYLNGGYDVCPDMTSDGIFDAVDNGNIFPQTSNVFVRGTGNFEFPYNVADTSLYSYDPTFFGTRYWIIRTFGDLDNNGYTDFGMEGAPCRFYISEPITRDQFHYRDVSYPTINSDTSSPSVQINSISIHPLGFDYNNDGFLDVIKYVPISFLSSEAHLYRNDLVNDGTLNFLRVKLQGVQTNRDAIDATVIITNSDTTSNLKWRKQIRICDGRVIHFGLGDIDSVSQLLVIWGSGKRDLLKNVSANQTLTIVEGSSPMASTENPATTKTNQFSLSQNYPNPFNPTTIIGYQLPFASQVRLEIFDMLGRRVATLVNNKQFAGSYQVTFNASELSSGVYFYKLDANGTSTNFIQTKKMMLVK